MGTSRNWLGAMARVERGRLEDAITEARRRLTLAARLPPGDAAIDDLIRDVPPSWPRLPNIRHPDLDAARRLLDKFEASPDHPDNWHRRLRDAALATAEAREIYFRVRAAIWRWREFATLARGARAILEVVIELARDEAFPWYLAVPAEHVRHLARLSEGRYARSARELECFAVERQASVLMMCNRDGVPWWVGGAEPVLAQERAPVAQFVVQYRRGIPWNRKRAAWWINYDLLCETGTVLPSFVVQPENLPRLYQSRNWPMGSWGAMGDVGGPAWREWVSRGCGRDGPPPPMGLRAPLWRGLRGYDLRRGGSHASDG